MIKSIPKFDGVNFHEWTRSSNDMLQISWPFLCNIIPGLERLEPIPRGSREVEKTTDFDNDSRLILVVREVMIRALK